MKVMHCCLFEGISYARHTFDKAGDELPLHAHPVHHASDIHTTIVAKGSFVLTGAREGQVVSAPSFIAWKLDEPHGMKALEDDSVIFNIRRTKDGDRECGNVLLSVPPPAR